MRAPPSAKRDCLAVGELPNRDASDEFEERYVHSVYDSISLHFNHTRYKPWRGVVDFLERLPVGSLVLDIGCGNGKHMNCTPGLFTLGVDRSWNLLSSPDLSSHRSSTRELQHTTPPSSKLSHSPHATSAEAFTTELLAHKGQDEKGKSCYKKEEEIPAAVTPEEDLKCFSASLNKEAPAAFQDRCAGDCLNISIRSDVADATLCIAVLHHLSTRDKRVQAVRELVRCTRIGGAVLIYVWALNHEERSIGARKFTSSDVFVPWTGHAAMYCPFPNDSPTNSHPPLPSSPSPPFSNDSPSRLSPFSFSSSSSSSASYVPPLSSMRSPGAHDGVGEHNPSATQLTSVENYAGRISNTNKLSKGHTSQVSQRRASSTAEELFTVYRYYHVFTEEELLDLACQCECEVEQCWFEANNWAISLRKTSNTQKAV